MSTWTFKNLVVRVRSLFNKKEPDPKEPRKKIQLQLKKILQQFQQQKEDLERTLETKQLTDSAHRTGKLLLAEVNRIDELQLCRINETRLNSLYSPLVDTNDFSIWLRHELSQITEEIFHFLSTLEEK